MENKRKVFISHSSANKAFVNKLKKDLNENGIETWLDADEMTPGDDLMEKLQNGLEDATHYIVVLSPEAVESEWVEFELESALLNTQDSAIQKIIPIKYRECTIPDNLYGYLHIDLSDQTVYYRHDTLEFFGKKYPSELDRLIKSIKEDGLVLTTEEKDDISNLKASILNQNDEYIDIYLSLVGYKSKSKFLDTYIDEKSWRLAERSKADFHPLVLPAVIKDYLELMRFGKQISIQYRNREKKADFAKFSQNNTQLALPKEIRRALGLRNLKMYLVRIHKVGSRIEFLRVERD